MDTFLNHYSLGYPKKKLGDCRVQILEENFQASDLFYLYPQMNSHIYLIYKSS